MDPADNDSTSSQAQAAGIPRAPLGPSARSAQIPAASDPLPKRIGSYRVVRLLGMGGMGVVYEAEQPNPRRKVALKVIRPEFVSDERLHRFALESAALARLQHAGIAQIYEAGWAGGTPFFAMELVRGRTLGTHANEERLSIRGRLTLMMKVVDAVHYAHTQSVIHLDLKPANVLVGPEGDPKILDFGVAQILGGDPANHLPTMGLVGTLRYMSPEQTRGRLSILDERSDVYALGVITYELLSGEPPYSLVNLSRDAAFEVIQEEPPAELTNLPGSVRSDIQLVVNKAIDKDPARRYSSAKELSEDLGRVLRGGVPNAARPTIAARVYRWAVNENRIEQAGIAGMVIAVILGLFNAIYAVIGVVMILGLAPYLASGIRVTEFTLHNLGWMLAAAVAWQASRRVRQKSIAWTWFAIGGYSVLVLFTILVFAGAIPYDMGGALADVAVRSVLYALLTPVVLVVAVLHALGLAASYVARKWDRPPVGAR